MKLFADIIPSTAKSMLGFGFAAFVLAFLTHASHQNIVLRILIELPLLMILASVMGLIVNGLAASCGAVLGGRALVSAFAAFAMGWALSGGGMSSFAGLGYHPFLQPAFALSLGAAWLLKARFQRT